MAEEIVEYAILGGITVAGFAAAGPLQQFGDRLADKYLNGYDNQKESMEKLLSQEQPDEEEFYELMGQIGEELSGCTLERATETTVFEAKKDALLDYAEDQTGENWDWLQESVDNLEYQDIV
jgi:hypothetical protein